MTDKFTNALLAALNESGEVNESDWSSLEAVLRQPLERPAPAKAAPPPEQVTAIDQAGLPDPGRPFDRINPAEPGGVTPQADRPQPPENRFAAMISSGMAKIRPPSS